MLLRALLAPNNEEFSFWVRVSLCLSQWMPEFLHSHLWFLFYSGLDLFHSYFGVVHTERAPEEICFNYVAAAAVKLLSRVWFFATPWTSQLGCSVHGISQARILEWFAICFSRGSSRPRDWTHISCLVGGFFTTEPPRKLNYVILL